MKRPRERSAYTSRIGVKASEYVAAFERGRRLIGCWSIVTILSSASQPSIPSCSADGSPAPWNRLRPARPRMSSTRDDLPDPEGPVTVTSRPSGIRTVRSLRLCARAPLLGLSRGHGAVTWMTIGRCLA